MHDSTLGDSMVDPTYIYNQLFSGHPIAHPAVILPTPDNHLADSVVPRTLSAAPQSTRSTTVLPTGIVNGIGLLTLVLFFGVLVCMGRWQLEP
ncbi:MAG TPA: hypothetical protein VFZ02_05925 [Ktedonobacteraceae bacterium]